VSTGTGARVARDVSGDRQVARPPVPGHPAPAQVVYKPRGRRPLTLKTLHTIQTATAAQKNRPYAILLLLHGFLAPGGGFKPLTHLEHLPLRIFRELRGNPTVTSFQTLDFPI
jgi:hypothetical protein